jgi:hypothetical protein
MPYCLATSAFSEAGRFSLSWKLIAACGESGLALIIDRVMNDHTEEPTDKTSSPGTILSA